MEDKLQTNTELGDKVTPIKDDTAQENILIPELPIPTLLKTSIENIIEFYYLENSIVFVALTKDYIKKNEPKLFHGQIGKIAFLPDKETCWVKFYDYEDQEHKLIHQLKLPKVDLFPLFFENPLWDTKEMEQKRQEFSNTQNVYLEKEEIEEKVILAIHRESDNRVSLNRIVTVGTDFNFTNENNTVFIRAGQVGRISQIFKNNLVEVSFESLRLNQLISKIKNNNVDEIDSNDVDELDSFENWSEKIIIHENYLVYLYYKNLDSFVQNPLYYKDFHRQWIKNKEFMEKFDPNTYFHLESCIKSDNCEDI